MTHFKTLIDQTFSYAQDHLAKGEKDLFSCYMEDYGIFRSVEMLLSVGATDDAIEMVEDMDTEPREGVIAALIKDGVLV